MTTLPIPKTDFIREVWYKLKNGDWWFMIMQDRDAIGRVPCLVPVKWIDGWPMLGDEGKDLITYPKPATGKKSLLKSPATTDEFNNCQAGPAMGSGTTTRTMRNGR